MRRRASAFGALALLVAVAQPLHAQQHAMADRDSTRGFAWERVMLSVHGGSFHSTGNSDVHRVVDRALTPGQAALEPFVTGGSLHVPLRARLALHVGVDGGSRTTHSESRVRPVGENAPVQQRTRFTLSSFVHAGVDVTAWQGREGMSLVFSAGAGRAAYTLQQDGAFVDVDRLEVFEDDLASSGRGTVGYVGAALDVPVAHWASLRADVRRQRGSAGMSGDFVGFDRFDLGGTRFSAGFGLRPFGR